MKCNGEFVYKGIEKRDGGEFTNDKGEVIKYDSSFQITVDTISEDSKIDQRKFKFPAKNVELANKFKGFDIYETVNIEFDVSLYNTTVRLVPIDVTSVENA